MRRPSELLSRHSRVGRRFGNVVTYILSETAEGWVLYDDEGRTLVLTDTSTPPCLMQQE